MKLAKFYLSCFILVAFLSVTTIAFNGRAQESQSLLLPYDLYYSWSVNYADIEKSVFKGDGYKLTVSQKIREKEKGGYLKFSPSVTLDVPEIDENKAWVVFITISRSDTDGNLTLIYACNVKDYKTSQLRNEEEDCKDDDTFLAEHFASSDIVKIALGITNKER